MDNNIISFASIVPSIQPNESSVITQQELMNETPVTLTINLKDSAKVAKDDTTITLPLNCHYAVEMHPEKDTSWIASFKISYSSNYNEDERIFFVEGGVI